MNKVCVLLILFWANYLCIAQDFKAIVSFENQDSVGSESLLYNSLNHLGKSPNERLSNTQEVTLSHEKYQYFFISNGWRSGIMYLKAGDTLHVVKENNIFKYEGANTHFYNLVEELYANDIHTQNSRDMVWSLRYDKAISYIEEKIAASKSIISDYLSKYSDIDTELTDMLQRDIKYKCLLNLTSRFLYEEYDAESYTLVMQYIKPYAEKLVEERYRDTPNFQYFQHYYADLLYLRENPGKLLGYADKRFEEQFQKQLEFWSTLDEPLREDVIYFALSEFFGYKIWGNRDIRLYTDYYYKASKDDARIKRIKELEERALFDQNREFHAQRILKDSVVRTQELKRLDGTTLPFGELLDSLKGHWIYLDLWATWCGPCRVEMNKLKPEIIQKIGTKVIFISVDEDQEKWNATAEKYYMYDGQAEHYQVDKNSLLIDRLFNGEFSIPRYFLIDKYQSKFYHNMEKPTQFNLKTFSP